MSNNIVRPTTMTNGFLVFKFYPQFHHLSSQTRGYIYESRQKVKILISLKFYARLYAHTVITLRAYSTTNYR